jgi:hypothetical protein
MLCRLISVGIAIALLAHLYAAEQRAGAAEPAAYSASSPPEEGVLVVHGGGVLEGTITRVGDRYRVARDHGQLDVAADRVTFVCRSRAEAYERQRQELPRDNAEAHLRLAEWCLRYDLVPQAAEELTEVRRLDPRHPQLALVERRLDVANQAASRVGRVDESHQSVAPQFDRGEMQRLEAAVADLPPGVVERFARKVQPLLVNNCTTAGCHQPSGKQEFQLDRAVLYGLTNRRTTLRNLTAALALVDRARPQASPLIVVPRESHGGMARPIFGPRQEDQLRQLVDWVALVTDSDVAETVTAADQRTVRRGKPSDRMTHLPAANSAVRPASHETEAATLRPKQPLRYGTEMTAWQPKDPFDPEIFNRSLRAADELRENADSPRGKTPSAR